MLRRLGGKGKRIPIESRHRYRLENLLDDVVARNVFRFGLVAYDYTMPQDVESDVLDVLRGDEASSLHKGQRLGRLSQADGGSGGCPEPDEGS